MYRYEFKKDDAFEFARKINAKTKPPKGSELPFDICPYCKGGAHRDKGSFSINLDTGQYKCLRESCGAKGNFVTLARDFDFSLGNDFDRYYSNKSQFYTFKKVEKIESADNAIKYMESRKISKETTQRYEITVRENSPNTLIFPFYDEKGILRYMKYRKTDYNKEKDGGYKEWAFALKDGEGKIIQNCMPILFGMKQCNDRFDRLIMTEGMLDSLSVSDCGIENAVSVPTGAKGFTWVPYCWDWFSKFEELIVFGDYEKGHITLLEELTKRFPGKIRHVRVEDYKGCKDANEILQKHGKQAIINAINNAEFIPVKRVIQFADVKKRDFSKIHKIRTGFKSLDGKILNGGLYAGQLVILTGKRGDGKSTWAGDIMAEALDQGNNVFSYSGELPDWFFREWLDKQMAGPQNVVENENIDGSVNRFITNSTTDSINSWVRDHFFLYDKNCIEDEEMEDLPKTIIDSIMQYGINLVVIDNLMTALDEDTSADEFRAQGKFVNKLARIAKRFDVVIILIAHPKKSKFTNDENDAVSGTSKITDAADIVFTFKRGENDEKDGVDTRWLSISKNRWWGKFFKGEGEQMLYNERSMRITDRYGDVNKRYGWEKQDEFTAVYDQEELPFGSEDD